jgi:phosphoribosylformylglycinamidine synthase
MSAKGEVGMRIDLDKVPTRQKNMKTWELLLSESQERMLLVATKGREEEVTKVFEKWDLPCSVIGEVTDDGLLDFYMNGELEASLPAYELVLGGGAPQYEREYKEPKYFAEINKFNPDSVAVPEDLKTVAEKLIQLPSIASKRWIYNQYDSMVGTNNTSTNTPTDAPVVVIKGTTKGIAMSTDCNSRYVFADPYKGAMMAVSEAARNIVCSGGQPLGVTNCLNFGNPYDPEVYYQFVQAIKGMGEACVKFDTPVTGGNVSFYNQNPDGPVYPTPTIGMVGLLDDVNDKMTLDFKEEGDVIVLIGSSGNDINSSQYLAKICGVEFSPAPAFELEEEFALQQKITELIKNGLIESAHDVSEGGLFVTLLESGFHRNLGFDVVAADYNIRKDAQWFGEKQSRVVVSVKAEKLNELKKLLGGHPFEELGVVINGSVEVDGMEWGAIEWWKEKYDTAIENYLIKEEAGSALSAV